jgi:predicted dehydrogenase
LRIAMLGCGTVARRYHLPVLRRCDDVEVTAFASRTLTSAAAAAEECGGGDVSSDWRSIIGRDDVEAVDICSPNAFHREQAVAAAKAGKHVLVEKPMASTVEEADEMIAAAEAAGVVLHVAHNMRYAPAIVAMRDAVTRVGRIAGVRTAFGHSGPRDWAPDSTWFFDPKLSGGGALIDLGIHAIDFVRYVTGLEVDEVAAMTFGTEAVEDAGHVIMRFEGGAIGYVNASWVARPAPDFALAVFGTEGTLRLDASRPPSFRSASGEKEELEIPASISSPYEDFVRAVRGGQAPGPASPASGADGRAAVAIVSAAYESARTGKAVAV